MSEIFCSPFAHVLHTNYAASTSEIQEIHDLLASPSEELSRLADEIKRVQRALDKLTSRYAYLKTHVDAHLALVSPFRRLPREIISEIFVRCLPTDRNPTRSLTEAPLLLTTISKGLREIALSTPQLWNALHVFLPHISFNSPVGVDELERIIQRRRAGVETWFTRSRCLPLSISVYLSGYGRLAGSGSDSSYVSFLKALVSFSRRWKRIELHLSPFFVDVLNQLVNDLGPEDVPLLDSVEIFYDATTEIGRPPVAVHLPSNSTRKPQVPLEDLINRAPSLQSFAVHHHSHSLHHLQLPFGNLTHLTMKSGCDTSRLTMDQTVHILANSPNLSTCTIGVLLTSFDSGFQERTIELVSLRALTLYFILPSASDSLTISDMEERFHQFFSIIRAPLLTKLAFIAKDFEFRQGISCIPFRPLLQRSECRLEELYLSFPLKSQSILVEFLRSLPTITHLYLDSCTPSQNRFDPEQDSPPVRIVDDALISHLTVDESNPSPVCPRLEKLVLPDCRYVSEEVLISFARSRAPNAHQHSMNGCIARLKLLDVYFSHDRSKHETDSHGVLCDTGLSHQREALRREGIAVNWHYPVRDTPQILDSPWGGLPKFSYSGWKPEALVQY